MRPSHEVLDAPRRSTAVSFRLLLPEDDCRDRVLVTELPLSLFLTPLFRTALSDRLLERDDLGESWWSAARAARAAAISPASTEVWDRADLLLDRSVEVLPSL